MNILQIFNKIPYPPKDGGSVAVFNFSEGFAKAGYHVDLLCLNTKKHFVNISEIKNKLPEKISIDAINITTDIKIIPALKNLFLSKIPYIAERFISEEFKKILTKKLQENNYKIIQIEGLYMMPYIDVIKKYSSAIVSFRAHNIEHEIWQLNLKQEKNFFKKIYLRNLVKRLKNFELSFLNFYDILIPITERDGAIFKKLGNKKPMHVSPTGIDIKKYDLSEQNFTEIKLFHLGSLDWTPNIEGLLWFLQNVWTKLSSKYPHLTFTIAGRNASDSFIKKISVYKKVIYKGEIENAAEFMHKNNVMIVPLLSGSGMRIKIIEGMACGNIILSTSKGAEGINGKAEEDFLIANTIDEFIQQISDICDKKISLKEISINAQQFISDNFDNFAITKSLLNFYSKFYN